MTPDQNPIGETDIEMLRNVMLATGLSEEMVMSLMVKDNDSMPFAMPPFLSLLYLAKR